MDFFKRIGTDRKKYIAFLSILKMKMGIVPTSFQYFHLVVERGSHKLESKRVYKLERSGINFNEEELELPLTLFYDPDTSAFQQKLGEFTVLMSKGGKLKKIGKAQINFGGLSQDVKFFDIPLVDTPDKTAVLQISGYLVPESEQAQKSGEQSFKSKQKSKQQQSRQQAAQYQPDKKAKSTYERDNHFNSSISTIKKQQQPSNKSMPIQKSTTSSRQAKANLQKMLQKLLEEEDQENAAVYNGNGEIAKKQMVEVVRKEKTEGKKVMIVQQKEYLKVEDERRIQLLQKQNTELKNEVTQLQFELKNAQQKSTQNQQKISSLLKRLQLAQQRAKTSSTKQKEQASLSLTIKSLQSKVQSLSSQLAKQKARHNESQEQFLAQMNEMESQGKSLQDQNKGLKNKIIKQEELRKQKEKMIGELNKMVKVVENERQELRTDIRTLKERRLQCVQKAMQNGNPQLLEFIQNFL